MAGSSAHDTAFAIQLYPGGRVQQFTRETSKLCGRSLTSNTVSWITKQIDWDAIHDKYQPLITSNMGNDGLFQVLDSMLAELKDGHVNHAILKCGPCGMVLDYLYNSSNVARYWEWYLITSKLPTKVLSERQYLGKT